MEFFRVLELVWVGFGMDLSAIGVRSGIEVAKYEPPMREDRQLQ